MIPRLRLRPGLVLLTAGLTLISAANPLRAETLTWDSNGSWGNAADWGGSYPTAEDQVVVVNPGGSANALIVDAPPSPNPGSWTGTGYANGVSIHSTTEHGVELSVLSMLINQGDLTIGDRAGVTVSGGGVLNNASGTVTVGGYAGSLATMDVNTSGGVTAASLFVGANSGTGRMTVWSGTVQSLGIVSIGDAGEGSLEVSGGQVGADSIFFIGTTTTGTGSVTISGGGALTNTNQLQVGATGKGTFTVNGGTATVGNTIVGVTAGSAGEATISDGVWDNTGYLVAGQEGSGTVNLNGGMTYARQGVVVGSTPGSSGSLVLAGGTLATTKIEKRTGGTLTLDWGTIRALRNESEFITGFHSSAIVINDEVVIDTQEFNIGIQNWLEGGGTLRKTGSGTLKLSGLNSGYYGGLTVEDGVLLITNDMSSSGEVYVDSNGTLGGAGTVGAVYVINDGTLAPGEGTGLFTIKYGLTMLSDSILALDFSGTGNGQFDQLEVSTMLNIQNITLSLNVSYEAQEGDSFQIFTGLRPGAATYTIETNLGAGLYWDVSELSSTGVLSIVPEPGSLALVAMGLAMLGGRRRESRRKLAGCGRGRRWSGTGRLSSPVRRG